MTAVLPGRELGRHDMAVHTCKRIAGKVGCGIRDVQHEEREPAEESESDDDRNLPLRRRDERPEHAAQSMEHEYSQSRIVIPHFDIIARLRERSKWRVQRIVNTEPRGVTPLR